MPFIIHRYLQKCKTNIYPPGLADFLRGSLTLISLAEIFNYEFYFDYESHPFFKCLTENLKYSKSIDYSIETLECIPPISYDNIKEKLIQIFQTNNNISLLTNSFEVSPIYKYHHNILKEILIPSKSLSDKINLFLNNTININLPFIICHFRISDHYMGKDKFISDSLFNNLLQDIYTVMEKNNHIPKENIIVITDCYDFKNRLKPYNISMIDSYPVHMGLHRAFDFEDIENTVIEFFLMTKSSKIYSFGIHDSSGFSKIINIIYDIPLINTIVNLNV